MAGCNVNRESGLEWKYALAECGMFQLTCVFKHSTGLYEESNGYGKGQLDTQHM